MLTISLVQMQCLRTLICVLGHGDSVTSGPVCSLVLDNRMTHGGELIFQLEGQDTQLWTILSNIASAELQLLVWSHGDSVSVYWSCKRSQQPVHNTVYMGILGMWGCRGQESREGGAISTGGLLWVVRGQVNMGKVRTRVMCTHTERSMTSGKVQGLVLEWADLVQPQKTQIKRSWLDLVKWEVKNWCL